MQIKNFFDITLVDEDTKNAFYRQLNNIPAPKTVSNKKNIYMFP